MDPADYLAAVEAGFRCLANGNADAPSPMHIPGQGGAFHAKGARVTLDRAYVAVKLNGNFPDNPKQRGLPTIQGVILLCDAEDGSLLAVMDSIEITLRRTAAASALAAKFLARRNADCIAICGCGEQGRAQLAALVQVLPLKRAVVWDIDPDKARHLASDTHELFGLDASAVSAVGDATLQAGVIVTATSARTAFLTSDCVSPGAFIAAVGADNPQKSEIAPELLASATVIADSRAQCAVMGDLHHAIEAGILTPADVHADLGELVVGRKPGRNNAEETFVFDSTGVGVQDAASAAWVYRRAMAAHAGSMISLGAP
jgi:ornithine cyclodeaminase/alanine dehydrogenase-like protein (mu-crystallin family)